MSEMQKNRIAWLDKLKGVGIIAVVFGHALISDIREASFFAETMYKMIYFFHMPLLMFCSGYAYTKYSSNNYGRRYIGKKFKKLMIPYIVYSVAVVCVFQVLSMIPITGSILARMGIQLGGLLGLVKDLLLATNRYATHLWYIYALFLFYCVHPVLERFLKKELIVVLALLLYLIKGHWDFSSLTILHNFFSVYLWFVLGCYFDGEAIIKSKARMLPCAILGLSISFGYELVFIFYLQGTESWLKYVWLLCTIAARLLCIYSLFLLFQNDDSRQTFFLAYLGKYSFSIYLFHQPFLCLCVVSVLRLFLGNVVAVAAGIATSICIPLGIESLFKRYISIKQLLKKGEN